MPTCLPRVVLPIKAPATPPVLSLLVSAHTVFVARKRKEREALLEWCVEEAAAVDKRARKSYVDWLLLEALSVEWNADPIIDLE